MKYHELISQSYQDLTPAEKKIADFILAYPNEIVHLTMNDLKNFIKVGDATIIRFSQKLGFSGFTDLKIKIAKDEFSDKKEKKQTQSNPLINEIQLSLNRTDDLIDKDNILKAAKWIHEAQRIFIFGAGHSGISALDFEKMLMRIGIPAYTAMDSYFQKLVTSSFTSDDLVILFSLSGKTREMNELSQLSHTTDTKVITITNNSMSPLAQDSDLVLLTYTDEFLEGGAILGRISQIYVAGLILEAYEQTYGTSKILDIREKGLRSIIDYKIDND